MAPLTGGEQFTFDNVPTNYLLNDFWAWQASDLLSNALRGALAEFIVAQALNLNIAESRKEWEAFDLLYEGVGEGGGRIEVKSSAFLQSWEQKAPSRIQFNIRPARQWCPESGFTGELRRQSDVYVFCVFTATDRNAAKPLDLNQWAFYVLPTKILNSMRGMQNSLSLSSLLKLDPLAADYGILGATTRLALLRELDVGPASEIGELERQISAYKLRKTTPP